MDSQPLVIMADNYAEAREWAYRHGYPSSPAPARMEGRSWVYVREWRQLHGRMGGKYVDLRRESVQPAGALLWLKERGFREVAA